jgi:hypothetical protein
MTRTLMLVGLVAWTLPNTASGESLLARVCAGDIRQYCGGVQPGGGAPLKECMKSHFSDLTADCQVAIVRVAAVGRACKSDTSRFCWNVGPANGAVAACMRAHSSELSEGCREAVEQANAGQSGPDPDAVARIPDREERPSHGLATTIVPMVSQGGTFLVPVRINDQITLKFTIDSGAADVSVPADVVRTLLRADTISGADFLGNQTYSIS